MKDDTFVGISSIPFVKKNILVILEYRQDAEYLSSVGYLVCKDFAHPVDVFSSSG